MLLGLPPMPRCGFGNRLLYYYNLRQEADQRGSDYFCTPWEGHQIFEGNLLGAYPPPGPFETFNFCLGEKFYSYNSLSTRDVFKLKVVPVVVPGRCAIHFRGTDFHEWNPKAILKKEYYYDSIKEVRDEVSLFVLLTDDTTLESYKGVVEFLESEKIPFYVGDNSSRQEYIADFSLMSVCDYIISSPSTFCISAGFIGKQKKIIHSKEWVEDRAAKNDKFWADLYRGGNEDYSIWRLI